MKEIPLLMSTPMVEATMNDIKSVTRRMRGLELVNEDPFEFQYIRNSDDDGDVPRLAKKYDDRVYYLFRPKKGDQEIVCECPYKKGDVLWVREAFLKMIYFNGLIEQPYYLYRAGISENTANVIHYKWKPSIHMPKEACRLRLKIVSVGVERLIDNLTDEEIVKEGIHFDEDSGYWYAGDMVQSSAAFDCFGELWSKINGSESWESNPWVWKITYKRITD